MPSERVNSPDEGVGVTGELEDGTIIAELPDNRTGISARRRHNNGDKVRPGVSMADMRFRVITHAPGRHGASKGKMSDGLTSESVGNQASHKHETIHSCTTRVFCRNKAMATIQTQLEGAVWESGLQNVWPTTWRIEATAHGKRHSVEVISDMSLDE